MNEPIIIHQGTEVEESYEVVNQVQRDKIDNGKFSRDEIREALELGEPELAYDGSGNMVYHYGDIRVVVADDGTPDQRIITIFQAS